MANPIVPVVGQHQWSESKGPSLATTTDRPYVYLGSRGIEARWIEARGTEARGTEAMGD